MHDETGYEAENGDRGAAGLDLRLSNPSPEPTSSMSVCISGQSENNKDEMDDDGNVEMKEAPRSLETEPRPGVSVGSNVFISETGSNAKIAKRLRVPSFTSLSAIDGMKQEDREESERNSELEKEIARLPEAGKSSDVAGVREEGNGEKNAKACEHWHCSHMSDISAEMPMGNVDNTVHQNATITFTEPKERQGPQEDQTVVANHEVSSC
jgi:hypothetical protein